MDESDTAAGEGPLDPSPDGIELSIARRFRGLRAGVPSLLFMLGWGLVILALGVGLGYLLTKVGSHDLVGRTDRSVERWFAHHRERELNEGTLVATYMAETVTVVIVGLVVVVGARIAYKRWREPLLVVAAVAGEVVIFLAITLLVHRPRPGVSHLDIAPPTSSYPSGHTAASVALYGSLALLAIQRFRAALLKRLLIALAFLAPVAVGVARLYRGMHYPTDVLAGLLLGATWLLVAVTGVRLGAAHAELRRRR
jgi:membrane-associated phospholipid phosphatase